MRLRIIVLLTTLGACISAGYVILTPMLRTEVSAINEKDQNSPTDGHSRLEDDAELAVKGLWSSDESEREAAKRKLIQLGPGAVKSLISLLEELLKAPGLRYIPGKEKEGQEAWDHYMRLPVEEKDDEAHRRLRSLEISSRLRQDAFELVGRLRAVEAVPILIEFMRGEISISLAEKWRPEMRALVQIGPPAVPDIAKALETGRTQASRRLAQGPSVIEQGNRMIRGYGELFQARCITVLGEIGDSGTLPVLHSLLVESQNDVLSRNIREAIRKIEERSGK